jgi:hypothetical protein
VAGYRTEAAQFARRIVTSEKYFEMLKSRAESGTLAPPVETLLLHYAFGKPVEHVTMVSANEADLGVMSVEQLAQRANRLHQQLEERMREDQRLEELTRIAKLAEQEKVRQNAEASAKQREEEQQSVFHAIDRKIH